jgi:hypothetical protein
VPVGGWSATASFSPISLAVHDLATYRHWMGSWMVILAFFVGPWTSLAIVTHVVTDPQVPGLSALRRIVRRSRPDPAPVGRPIEAIAQDARRLGCQLQHADDGRSAARITAIRLAYDDVLAECCAALGLEQLLGVLDEGPELDAERRRVEVVLSGAGMVLADAY